MSQPDEQSAPPITEQMREYARQNPNSWLYIVDPGYEQEGEEVPPEGVIGAYRIDENGELDEDFQANGGYQPSELTSSAPEPVNELEHVLNRIAAGEQSESELPGAVLDAELLLYSPSEDDDTVYAAEMSDGSELVPACTSAGRVPTDWPGYRAVPGRDLPGLLGGYDLGINLTDPVQAVIPHSVLAEAAGGGSSS
ncbi:type VII secretion system-associated protein [Saccharopolyspora sp. HNM0983]|uniref:Type VII secretion system-associated protein n=1 Tax=Saccharopolyspora montiporae TaxID=2781240 RepID=A0A929BAF1_9PSEU|nr:type VII secretion system-associated protein [Saccharopolyspora sp. HNM0983]MBE9374770.1 type VII secretion system-associated protein [Saccharopolyspora sp. HNM0983]